MIVDVVAGLAVRGTQILLVQRHQSKITEWSGAWCLAGGKVEEGETRERALAREWQEELSGLIEVGPLLHAMLHRTEGYPHPYRVSSFAVTPITEPRLLPAGGQAMRWAEVSALPTYRLLPGTAPAVLAYNALNMCSWEINQ